MRNPKSTNPSVSRGNGATPPLRCEITEMPTESDTNTLNTSIFADLEEHKLSEDEVSDKPASVFNNL